MSNGRSCGGKVSIRAPYVNVLAFLLAKSTFGTGLR